MSFARRISTRQLIALCAVVVAAAVAGTALAVAAGAGGPKPRAKSLAAAIHDAAAAPAPGGVTARIDFTNHLISASSLQGSDPLLSGASGRLWVTKDGHVRVELQSSRGDAQIVSDGSRFWAYDASANTVYHGQIPQHAEKKHEAAHHAPTLGQINGAIGRLSKHLALSGASPGDVAGQPAYTVQVAPKDSGGLLGAVSLAWDSVRGVPLRVALYARGHDTPVIEVKVTDISYGPVAAGDLAISPPKGAKSVDVSPPQRGRAGHRGGKKPVTGLAAVHKAVGFPVTAPASLAGRPRTGVRRRRRQGRCAPDVRSRSRHDRGPGAQREARRSIEGRRRLEGALGLEGRRSQPAQPANVVGARGDGT